ncbi:unnamed protein product [marine sediment metagenome]|uniref:Uncharacterized protein n=1 Tax=marine sediment metagenome TaxID=412755 RepID=X1AS55_9ZZZZ
MGYDMDTDSIFIEGTDKIYNIDLPPELSDWHCELFGSGPYGMIFCPPKGKEPNRFWRLMQYLCFGNKWKKDEKSRG